MLSGPPFSLAFSIKRCVAVGRSGALTTMSSKLLIGDGAAQAVAAEQHRVAGARRLEARVDLDGVLHPEGAHDHVLVREVRDLFLGEVLHLLVVVEQRVVLGQLLDRAVADAVHAAVADVRDVHAVFDGEERGERGAHAALLRVASAPVS